MVVLATLEASMPLLLVSSVAFMVTVADVASMSK